MHYLDETFGQGGSLARQLPGFRPRAAQQEMAERVAAALAAYAVFIAESGTGTGKTFAYLVPALLSGKKVLISTGTRNLQDQLYHRDLPLVRGALGIPVNTALLKGRANYLCRHRLERAPPEGRAGSRTQDSELSRIRAWSRRTRSGDIAELADVPEQSGVWPLVTSTSDNCVGGECRHYDDCFVNRARRDALGADVVVVNHHLFFADLALRDEGFGRLLPGVEAVIFDEAHQLPDVAANFFGQNLSSRQILGLCRDAIAEDVAEHSGIAELPGAAHALEHGVAELRLALGSAPRREALDQVARDPEFVACRAELGERLARLATVLEAAGAAGEGLASCARRAAELRDRMAQIGEGPEPDRVAWCETGARGFVLHVTPLDIAEPFREHRQSGRKSWIFTSATLAINRRFDHFQERLGLEEADTELWDSPFDYGHQALLYLPEGMPMPSAPDYTQHVVETAAAVLAASGGRAFILFTSHRALKFAAERLRAMLEYPLLVQGEAPRSDLLARFRAAGNAVLLGTGSFWEGVDVRGPALSCVIIDKLPFDAPDDPVLRARAAALEQTGGNAFAQYQLPEAVIALKQGAGRLIRDEGDRGVLVLCDPRLRRKGYGKVFLASLPPMPCTDDLAAVHEFFSRTAQCPPPAHETAAPG